MPEKRVVLCADDFGLSAATSRAILGLARRQRLSAISCMTQGAEWPVFAAQLAALDREHRGDLSIGLHFNLTETLGEFRGRGLMTLIGQSYIGAWASSAAMPALQRQFQEFEHAFQRAPDFVDGHQHVHQLPGIRDALLDLLERRYGASRPAVRSTVPARWRGVKPAVIAALGGRTLHRRLLAGRYATNTDFDGVYGFDAALPYRSRMQAWLTRIEDSGLIMCHPADAIEVGDPIATARVVESKYLGSDNFTADLEAAGARLIGFKAAA